MSCFRSGRILITGADGGLGQHLVAAFLARGDATIVAAGLRRPGLDALVERHGSRVEPCVLDITDQASLASAAATAFAGLTMVVNCAGVETKRRCLDPDAPRWARLEAEVNYLGLVGVCHAALPHLRRAPQRRS